MKWLTPWAKNPDIHFAVSSEIYDEITDSTPEAMDRLMDIGTDWELVEGIEDGLGTLVGNLGIDVPDSLAQIIPYAGAVVAGARLIYSVIRTEREFREVDRTTKNKIQVVQTLTLMARMGITTVLSATGASGGAAVGTAVPGVGNLIGGGVGALGGGVMGMYLNKHLQPHMLQLGLSICGLEEDDLFYFKNKSRVDRLALSFAGRRFPEGAGADSLRKSAAAHGTTGEGAIQTMPDTQDKSFLLVIGRNIAHTGNHDCFHGHAETVHHHLAKYPTR